MSLLKVSRPRFWMYLAGPYFIGFFAGGGAVSFSFLAQLVYFLLPANFFLYAVNDVFDEETDRNNPKKQGKEERVRRTDRKKIVVCVFFALTFAVPFFLLNDALGQVLFAVFLFLCCFYSAPPLRFKAVPLFDSASNVLYAIPGFLGYVQATGWLPPSSIVVAAACWCAAMHLFSAVPDIKYDKSAGLRTTAVVLGKKCSLMVCLLLWILAAVLIVPRSVFLGIVGLMYPLLVIVSFALTVRRVYWWFPVMNTVVGFVCFLVLIHKSVMG